MSHTVVSPKEAQEFVDELNSKYRGKIFNLALCPDIFATNCSHGKFQLENIKLFDYEQVLGSGFQKYRYQIAATGNFKLPFLVLFSTQHRLFFGIDPTNNYVSQLDNKLNSMKKIVASIQGKSTGMEFLNSFVDVYNIINGKRPKPNTNNSGWTIE